LYANLSLIVSSTSTIALLAYVLFRRGRRLRDFGLTVKKEDILVVPLLTVLTFVPNVLVRAFLGFPLLRGVEAHPWLSLAGIPSLGVFVLVSQLLNAACEELVVRAFMITEVVELTGQVSLAVLSSVCFQGLYHLYQGSSSALMAAGGFLICSIYYVRYRRIAPIILSHFLYDVLIYGYWASARS
jgi:membrane protease YdiL (CAAX protease family)